MNFYSEEFETIQAKVFCGGTIMVSFGEKRALVNYLFSAFIYYSRLYSEELVTDLIL
jgi:hypothetical protein